MAIPMFSLFSLALLSLMTLQTISRIFALPNETELPSQEYLEPRFAPFLKGEIKKEFISEDKECFDAHGSAIVETIPRHFCAVWKGGPGEGKSNEDIKENVGIWLSLTTDKGWSAPIEIVEAKRSLCWAPVLCKLSPTELLLFYRRGKDPRHGVSFLKRSFDGGIQWANEEILPAGIVGPTRGRPLLTEHGTLICPSSIAVGDPEELFKATAIWFDITEDGGKHWRKIGPLELPTRKFGVVEPVLFKDGQGRLRILCRDRAHKISEKGFIWSATSNNEGITWSQLEKTDLPNPDSGIDIVDLGKGKLLLLYNHSHTHRYPLHIATSVDGGNSWSHPYILDEKGEFPSGILAADGNVHITYATETNKGQRRIRHAVLNPSELFLDLKEKDLN